MQADQIVALYEKEGANIEAIAEAMDLEVEAVKMCLASSSVKFRQEMKKDVELFGDRDLDQAKMVMQALLFSAEDTTKFRAAKFIINEKMGRHNLSNLKNLNVNVTTVNIQLQQARARDAIKRAKGQKVIDVESSKQQDAIAA